jgi:ATP-binding cassette subfamily B protein
VSTPKSGKAFDLPLVKRIYSLAKPYKWLFLVAVIATLLMAVLNPFRALLTQQIIDHHVLKGDKTGLLHMTMWVIGLLIFTSFVQYIQTILTNYIGQEVIKNLRMRVFQHISRYTLKKLDDTPVGALVTRAVSDLETLADVFSSGLVSIVGDLLQILFIVILMFSQNWELTLVALSVLPILLYSGNVFKNAVKRSFIDTRNQVTRLNTFVQEHIQGMQVVQIFNRQEKEYSKFDEINKAHRDANNKGVFAYAVFFPVVEFITSISTALIIWFGVGRIIEIPQEVTIGMLTEFLMLINMFFRPLRQLADRFNTLQMGMVAADRVFQLVDDKEAIEHGGKIVPTHLKGKVKFEQVWFAYKEGNDILKDISFTVEPGKTLALVGATGAGKSTIINLISRFYDIQKGAITLDDEPIQNFDLDSLRSNVCVVMQDVFLFSGTIFDNLVLFEKDIPIDKVVEVCKLVGIHHFIESLPEKYMQPVSERGASLSTGQRQLISMARTMLANPRVLILDEATSSVDTHSEELIQNAISLLMKNRTSIVIAHRLSTILHADEIMVIDQGRIMEKGTHHELLAQNGIYKKLYERQFEVA